jgi:hypothetical protein
MPPPNTAEPLSTAHLIKRAFYCARRLERRNIYVPRVKLFARYSPHFLPTRLYINVCACREALVSGTKEPLFQHHLYLLLNSFELLPWRILFLFLSLSLRHVKYTGRLISVANSALYRRRYHFFFWLFLLGMGKIIKTIIGNKRGGDF